jgi:hypothetical protein
LCNRLRAILSVVGAFQCHRLLNPIAAAAKSSPLTSPSPTRWREAVWICRERRTEEIARRTAPEADRAAAWQAEREGALAAIAALPEKRRAQLRAIAAQGPAGVVPSPDAPLFTIRLVRAYRAYQAWRQPDP